MVIWFMGAMCATASQPAVVDLREWLAIAHDQRPALGDQPFATVPLDRAAAATAAGLLRSDFAATLRATRAAEMQERVLRCGDHALRFEYSVRGTAPIGGRSLYISLHGGGGTTAEINDRQWENHKTLYAPAEGVYFVPRAPTDTWDLWHQAHIDVLFQRAITNLIVFEGVDPNRVYLMGYSAGGDGVYQLAPRMAERWAAAAMMAGHPNETSPLGLRNVPFTIHVGADDAAYHRNDVARDWSRQLAALHGADAEGYVHAVHIHEGKGHWLNHADRVAVPWLASHQRAPFPERLVWVQDDVVHERYYWLALPAGTAVPRQHIEATRQGQQIVVHRAERCTRLIVRCNDDMIDLDRPVVVRVGDRLCHADLLPRTIATLHDTLLERGDPVTMYSAQVAVDFAPANQAPGR